MWRGTQAVTAGVLAALSDLLAQRLAGARALSWRRAAAVGVRLPPPRLPARLGLGCQPAWPACRALGWSCPALPTTSGSSSCCAPWGRRATPTRSPSRRARAAARGAASGHSHADDPGRFAGHAGQPELLASHERPSAVLPGHRRRGWGCQRPGSLHSLLPPLLHRGCNPCAGLPQRAAAARLRAIFPDVLLNGWKASWQPLCLPAERAARGAACRAGSLATCRADRQRLQFWPLVSALNYSLVPLEKRVLVINLAALVWCRPSAAASADHGAVRPLTLPRAGTHLSTSGQERHR